MSRAQVLDIEEAAPRPGVASALVVRRADVRRASTQAWRLSAPDAPDVSGVSGASGAPGVSGARRRMCCAHANLCVRPASPLGLVPGTYIPPIPLPTVSDVCTGHVRGCMLRDAFVILNKTNR